MSPRAPRLLLAALLASASATADTVHLVGGDRITGKVAASGKRAQRVVTPFGRLLIPNAKIDKIVYDDGREEDFLAVPSVPREHLRLQFTLIGDSFWQAWDPRNAPEDPTLRLMLMIDGEAVATYIDTKLDSDIENAVVNTFAFEPQQTVRTTWQEARALPPEATPGRVRFARVSIEHGQPRSAGVARSRAIDARRGAHAGHAHGGAGGAGAREHELRRPAEEAHEEGRDLPGAGVPGSRGGGGAAARDPARVVAETPIRGTAG
jgi:hypothetical protein